MLARIGTGLSLATGITLLLLLAPWWLFALLILAALYLCVAEFQAMARPQADSLDRLILFTAILAASVWPFLNRLWPIYDQGFSLLLGSLLLALARLARATPIQESMKQLSADALGLLYLGLTTPYIFLLRGEEQQGGWLVLMVMLITFLQDTGAYFAGRSLGRHPLAPKISPKKTIEGALGGILLGSAAAFFAWRFFPGLEKLSPIAVLGLGLLGTVMGILGDLTESLMKRAYKIKDSGTLLPGHGGLLDRVDGLLFAGPSLYLYLKLFI